MSHSYDVFSDLEDEPAKSGSSTPALAAAPPKPSGRAKWAGEDEEEEQVSALSFLTPLEGAQLTLR